MKRAALALVVCVVVLFAAVVPAGATPPETTTTTTVPEDPPPEPEPLPEWQDGPYRNLIPGVIIALMFVVFAAGYKVGA